MGNETESQDEKVQGTAQRIIGLNELDRSLPIFRALISQRYPQTTPERDEFINAYMGQFNSSSIGPERINSGFPVSVHYRYPIRLGVYNQIRSAEDQRGESLIFVYSGRKRGSDKVKPLLCDEVPVIARVKGILDSKGLPYESVYLLPNDSFEPSFILRDVECTKEGFLDFLRNHCDERLSALYNQVRGEDDR